MDDLKLAEAHAGMSGPLGELSRALLRAYEALRECNKYNHVNSDLQAYLFDKVEWGLGENTRDVKIDDYLG